MAFCAYAEETNLEKVETATNKSVDSIKSSYREAKDKACETINGKLQCAGKKLKNGALNLMDKAKTSAKEAKKKVD
jgi:hypothetical protein